MRRVRRTDATDLTAWSARRASVPVRLAVTAVIAGHARLDDAGSVRCGKRITELARVRGQVEQPGGIRHTSVLWTIQPRQRRTNERAECLLVHAPTSTASMMPMIAASTAA